MIIFKMDLLALYLSETYCHKTGTRPPIMPKSVLCYSLDKGQYFGLEISLHPLLFPNLIHTCYCKIWCRWMSFNWLFFLLPQDLSTSIICLWSKLVDYIWSIFRAYQKGKLSASRVIHEWRKQNMKGRANRWVIIA